MDVEAPISILNQLRTKIYIIGQIIIKTCHESLQSRIKILHPISPLSLVILHGFTDNFMFFYRYKHQALP